MLCEKCGQNEANIVFTKVVDGEKTVQNLCQSCMQGEEKTFTSHFAGLIPSFVNLGNLFHDVQVSCPQEIKCEKCGMTWSGFQKSGEFGCADCYNTFRAQLMPVLKRVHGNAKHAGKIPRSASEAAKQRGRIAALRGQLNEAVNAEKFEEAAKLRDELRAMEGDEQNAGQQP